MAKSEVMQATAPAGDLVERERVVGILVTASALGLPEVGLELVDNGTPLEAAKVRLAADASARKYDPQFAAIRKRMGECPGISFEVAAKQLGIEGY